MQCRKLLGIATTVLCLLTTQAPLQAQMFTMEHFLGVNAYRTNPVGEMDCVGLIREFHDWTVDQVNYNNPPIDAVDPDYPNQQFMWNPPFQNQGAGEQFDFFYDQMKAQGLTLCADLKGSLVGYTHIPYYTYSVESQEWKPFHWTPTDPLLLPNQVTSQPENVFGTPYDYKEFADWGYHYAARYGQSTVVPDCRLKYAPDETLVKGLSHAKYIECWNEQDKTWNDRGKFTTTEYATLASTTYDGNEGQVQPNGPNTSNGCSAPYATGVHNADPNAKYVLGGLFDLNWEYAVGINDALKIIRPSHNSNIFDVLNFHHYSYTGRIDIPTDSKWICPEEDKLKMKLIETKTKLDAVPEFQGKEYWLSEFGYDTNNSTDPYQFPGPTIPQIGDNSIYETQAQWIARSFLEVSAAKWDRAMVHDMIDSAPIWAQSTGLLYQSGAPKTSWFYVSTLKNRLKGKKFIGSYPVQGDTGNEFGCDDAHRRLSWYRNPSDPCDQTYVVWNPSSCDIATYYTDIAVLGACNAQEATGYYMREPSTTGFPISLNASYNNAGLFVIHDVPVSETPLFIVYRGHKEPVCPKLEITDVSCSAVTIGIGPQPAGITVDNYQVWYAPTGQVPDPAKPDFSVLHRLTGDLGGTATSVSVPGLLPATDYYIYVLPQNADGMPADPDGNPDFCYVQVTTGKAGSVCHLPITPQMVVYSSDDVVELFDEQGFNFCTGQNPAPAPSTEWLNYVNGATQAVCIVDLGDSHKINNMYLFDASDTGLFEIEWSNDYPPGSLDPNAGTWHPLKNYYTYPLNQWASIFDFDQPATGLRYLRFTNHLNRAKIKELFICADRVEACLGDGAVPLAPVFNTASTTDAVLVQWSWPFGQVPQDFESLTFTMQNAPQTSIQISDPGTTSVLFDNLDCGTVYEFDVVLVDCEGNKVLATVKANTESCPPCEIRHFEGISTSCKRIDLHWDRNNCPKDYTIYFEPQIPGEPCPKSPTSMAGVLNIPSGSTSATIKGLDAETCYCIFIETTDQDGAIVSAMTEVCTPTCIKGCEGCDPVGIASIELDYTNQPGGTLPTCENINGQPGLDDPALMFDEQQFLSQVCEGDLCGKEHDCAGHPVTEWFPGWSQAPYSNGGATATINLDDSYQLKHIFIYDTHDVGSIRVEYVDDTGNNVVVAAEHHTYGYRSWCEIPFSNYTPTSKVLITKLDPQSRFAEVVLCGRPLFQRGVGERSQTQNEVAVLPNPTSGQFTLRTQGGVFDNMTLLDCLGRVVVKQALDAAQAEHSFSLDGYPSGIYQLYLSGESGIKKMLKLVKL